MTRGMAQRAASDTDAGLELAKRVRARRTHLDLTQLEVAGLAGVTPGTIYWLEREGRGSLATLRAVARALECPLGDLVV